MIAKITRAGSRKRDFFTDIDKSPINFYTKKCPRIAEAYDFLIN